MAVLIAIISRGFMKRFLALFCALFLSVPFSFADENMDGDSSEDNNKKEVASTPKFKYNEPGDQFIKIDLMATAPLNFGGSFPLYRSGKMSLGGAGSLGYHRFITSWFAAGLNVKFGYNPTIGENIFTYIPIMLDFTFQPAFGRLEFPLTLSIGGAMENYLSNTYFPGLTLEGEAGVFYRATPSWSFGLETNYMYMPQWYSDSSKNDYGVFGSLGLSARYHF